MKHSIRTSAQWNKTRVSSTLGIDYPIIQGVILLFSAAYVIVNLLVDLSYTVLDPRVRY